MLLGCVNIQRVVKLTVILLSWRVVRLNGIVLRVVRLNVVAPFAFFIDKLIVVIGVAVKTVFNPESLTIKLLFLMIIS